VIGAIINGEARRAIFNTPDQIQSRFAVPVLQCLQIKPLTAQGQGQGPQERYRVVLSDIKNYVQCMLATQANHVVHDGVLQRGCIVRIKSYQANMVKGKKYAALRSPIR
jgi:replication factor A1